MKLGILFLLNRHSNTFFKNICDYCVFCLDRCSTSQPVVEVVEIKVRLHCALKSEINNRKVTYSKEDQYGVFTGNSGLNLHTDHMKSLLNF